MITSRPSGQAATPAVTATVTLVPLLLMHSSAGQVETATGSECRPWSCVAPPV